MLSPRQTDPTAATSAPVSTRQRLTAAGIGALLLLGLGACSYTPPASLATAEGVYRTLNTAPYATPTEADRWTVIDDPAGGLIAQHGFACATRSRAATRSTIGVRVQEEAPIPAGYQATVFLNGWHTNYQSSDHHVTGLGTTIFNVARIGNTLYWDAGGILSDKNGDDAFRWCYRYTVLLWSPTATQNVLGARIDLGAVVSEPGQRLISVDLPQATQGRILGIPSSYTMSPQPPRGKLLMGFALAFENADHAVMQTAFDFGRHTISGNAINWTSKAILKDRNEDDDAFGAAMATLLTGRSVKSFQPSTVQVIGSNQTTASNDFTMATRSGQHFCAATGTTGDRTVHYAVPNVPYRWAIPMLTAWDLGPVCDDTHVKRVGAHIENWWYDRAPGTTSGTLHYIVRHAYSDNGSVINILRNEVTVLGIDPVISIAPGSVSGATFTLR